MRSFSVVVVNLGINQSAMDGSLMFFTICSSTILLARLPKSVVNNFPTDRLDLQLMFPLKVHKPVTKFLRVVCDVERELC